MKCLRCGYDKFITIPEDDGEDMLQCTRCGAMRRAGFFLSPPTKPEVKRTLPTEEEMVSCARGT